MAGRWPEEWPARWPQYLPYDKPIPTVRKGWVPNASAIDWPQAQFAPEFLRPGSPSFQPYSYDNMDNAQLADLYVQSEEALGCTDCGYGEGWEWTVPVIGVTVTPKCIVGLSLGAAVGWYLRGVLGN